MQSEIIGIVATVLALLFSGNIYFIKKLVDKVDATAALGPTITILSTHIHELKQDLREMRRIEIEVAVLKSQLNPAKASTSQA